MLCYARNIGRDGHCRYCIVLLEIYSEISNPLQYIGSITKSRSGYRDVVQLMVWHEGIDGERIKVSLPSPSRNHFPATAENGVE
jgi:hypothetical protein